jgi:COP9 signalosome complex subunit 5
MAGTSSDSENARKTWELENNIETIPACDEIFRYDAKQQQQILGKIRSHKK